jgi:two-component system, sensor histidine kinase LadS
MCWWIAPARGALLRLSRRLWMGVSLCVLLLAQSPAWAQAAPVDALRQVPAQATAKSEAAPSLTPMRKIVLDARSTQVRLDGLTEFWLDDDLDTPITAVVARANAGRDLFASSSVAQIHQAQGKTLWLRFEVHELDQRSRWMLELNSPLIDDAQLFWQSANGQWLTLKAGDAVPRSQWPLPTRLPTFELQERGTQPVQYYLRLQHARLPISLPLTIYRDTSWLAAKQTTGLLLGVMLGLIVLILSISILMAVGMRDTAFAAHAVYLLALGFFMLTNTGLTQMYLWPNSTVLAERMNFTLAALTAALGPWLARSILLPAMRQRLLDAVITALALVMLCITAVEFLASSALSYRLLHIGILLTVIVICCLVTATWRRTDSVTRWVALCFAPVAIAAIPPILRNLGWIPNNWLAQYSILIASCIHMPILLYALLLRSIRRLEGKARALGLPTHDALTGLPNLRIFLEQMHGSMTRAQRFNHHYGLILVDLSNHAWFVKEHGREMADRATVLCGTRLRELIRDVDGICRIDESQFAILLEGHCSAGLMTKLSARIGACAHQPTPVLPIGANLKLFITCALMPTAQSREAGDDANAQLGWLIAAAEAIPQENHKTVRTIGL